MIILFSRASPGRGECPVSCELSLPAMMASFSTGMGAVKTQLTESGEKYMSKLCTFREKGTVRQC